MRMKERIKKAIVVFLALIMVFTALPIDMTTARAAVQKPKKLVLNHSKAELIKGRSMQLKVKKTVPAKASKSVTFSSTNKKVATVTKTGKVKAKKAGTAKIIAKSKANAKVKAVCKVKVYNRTKKIRLQCQSSYTLAIGQSVKLKAKVTSPTKQTQPITWKSNQKAVASVSKNGTVKAIGAGTARITASSGGKKVTVHITVQKPSDPVPAPTDTTAYTVSFESNGGTPVASQTVLAGQTAVRPADPVKTGYALEGWYLDAALTQAYDFNLPVNQNLILYAKWRMAGHGASEYYVTFVLNDGSAGAYERQVVGPKGHAVKPAEDPSRASYRFTGWYLDAAAAEAYDFSQEVSDDLTLYAGWGSPDAEDSGIYSAESGGGTIYSVSDIKVQDGQAEVTVNVNATSVLVVDFLDESGYFGGDTNTWDGNTATVYETVSAQTPGYCELAKITIPIDAGNLPEHFLVRASLYDENAASRCEPYVCASYTSAYKAFENQTIEDFAGEEVLNFDDNPADNFGVLADGIKKIESTSDVNILSVVQEEPQTDDSDGFTIAYHNLYTFANADASVLSLAAGDRIHIQDADGQQYLVKIGTIEANEAGDIVITESSDTELTDFYKSLKVSMDVKNDTEEEIAPMAEIIDVETQRSVELGISVEAKLRDWLSVSGQLSGKGTVTLTMAYDAHLFRQDYFECSVVSKTEATLQIKVEASIDNGDKVDAEIKGVKVPVPTTIPGLSIYYAQTIPMSWKISGNASFQLECSMEEGFRYDTNSGKQDIDQKTYAVDVGFNAKAEVSFGPKFALGVSYLNEVLKAEVGVQAGVKASVSRDSEAEITNEDEKHACTLCLKGEAKWFVKASAKLKYTILKGKVEGTPFDLEYTAFEGWITFTPLKPGQFYISILNSQDSMFEGKLKFGGGSCPNKRYKTIIEVYDAYGNALSGKPVVVRKQNSSFSVSGNSVYTTYLYNGVHQASSQVDNENMEKSFVVNGAAQTVRLRAGESDKGIVYGMVCDSKTNAPLPGATVQLKQGDMVIASRDTGADGSFRILAPDGTYRVEISKQDYITFSTYETMENSGEKYMETIRLVPGNEEEMGGFSGQITDALTGDPVSGVKLALRSGWNNSGDGDVLKTLMTNEDGYFLYDTYEVFGVVWGLPSGEYTLTASKDEYATISFNIIVSPGVVTGNQNATISKKLLSDEYRIVLRWGETPRDLDSHYNALTLDGEREHVYYSDMWGETANLDVDDTTSYGPETITVTGFGDLLDGFVYSVHDYTNEGEDYSTALSSSGAYVTLYHGEDAPRFYYVPTGRDGTVWNVFAIRRDGTIVSLNTFGYASEYDVGLDYLNGLSAFRGASFVDLTPKGQRKKSKGFN